MNTVQPTLPGLIRQLSDQKAQAIGMIGEQLVYQALEAAGYRPVTLQHGGCDLRAISPATGEIFCVEVKTSRRGKDGRWRFKLYKAGHTDHRKSQVVVLLAITLSGDVIPFVIPTSELQNQRQAVISSDPRTYSGRLAAYRQKLDTLTLN